MNELPLAYPPATRGRIVVWGFMANLPLAGIVWQCLHHVVGFRRLGFDVWYVEDTDIPVSDPDTLCQVEDAGRNAAWLADVMRGVGLEDRWIMRAPSSEETYGAPERLADVYAAADAAFNVTGWHDLGERHDAVENPILLETDPVESQIRAAGGDRWFTEQLERYSHRFTYGQNLGADDCRVPLAGFDWEPTRPPVCVDWWATDEEPAAGAPLSTIVNWSASGKDVTWEGETYRWRKDVAFRPFMELPASVPLPLELAVLNAQPQQLDELRAHGWRTSEASAIQDPFDYREYVRRSAGELTVAKDQYVRSRSGWFSDRSVCYLAAGRPVITQETGFSRYVPAGEGLFAFSSPEEAAAAVEAVAADPQRHRRAARAIAAEYFDAERVLGDVARRAGLL